MKKYLVLGILGYMCAQGVNAQSTVDNFSMGAGYANSTYYTLSDGSTSSTAHTDWDIAFTTSGAGILINEGAAYSGSPTKIHTIANKQFSDVITSSDFGAELLNEE